MTVLVFLDPALENGRIADATKPQLMATDLGATRGDGIFESLLAVDGVPRKVQAHLDRLASSARISSAKACGDSLTMVASCEAKRSRIAGIARTRVMSAWILATTGSGVPRGAITPYQTSAS